MELYFKYNNHLWSHLIADFFCLYMENGIKWDFTEIPLFFSKKFEKSAPDYIQKRSIREYGTNDLGKQKNIESKKW